MMNINSTCSDALLHCWIQASVESVRFSRAVSELCLWRVGEELKREDSGLYGLHWKNTNNSCYRLEWSLDFRGTKKIDVDYRSPAPQT